MQVVYFFCLLCFFFNDTATTEIYTLSLHDALPIGLVRAACAATSDAGGDRKVELVGPRATASPAHADQAQGDMSRLVEWSTLCVDPPRRVMAWLPPSSADRAAVLLTAPGPWLITPRSSD